MKGRLLVSAIVLMLAGAFAPLHATETPQGSDAFTDVPAGYWADTEIGWAVANSITSGTSATMFTPEGRVTRAQFVTFLHRLARLRNHVSVSPSAQGTVFLLGDQVLAADPRALTTRTISDIPDTIYTASLSPDRTKWLLRTRGSQWYHLDDLWVMNTDGSDPRNIAEDVYNQKTYHGVGATWSPNSQQVLFLAEDSNDVVQPFTMKWDGTGKKATS